MYAKLVFLIVVASVVGLLLLAMRQQRLELMHEVTDLYRQTHTTRQQMWALQSRAAVRLKPARLMATLERSPLHLEATTQEPPDMAPGRDGNTSMAWAAEERHHGRQ